MYIYIYIYISLSAKMSKFFLLSHLHPNFAPAPVLRRVIPPFIIL